MMTQQDPSHNHLKSSPNFGLAMTDVVDWRMPRPPLPFRLMAPDMRVLDVLGHRGVPPVRVVVCADPPLGAARWTVRFITEQVLKHTLVAQVGRDTIRARLYRHDLKPWRGKHMWGIADLDAAYIACRDAVLTRSERPYSVREPVVCLDEKRCPCMPRGGPRDRRGGPANIVGVVEPNAGRDVTCATRNRSAAAVARVVRTMVHVYPRARTIHLVLAPSTASRAGADRSRRRARALVGGDDSWCSTRRSTGAGGIKRRSRCVWCHGRVSRLGG